ncbi:MAG: class I SAM-dependent methyltransferase [Theionarchaea archaeon]|nr:MAG: hypothetical protein AYK19_00320 [Theionarchaea archaeon DG-70-1]MBU7025616.1 class I SAM-dependent methyltransferase [Theionarchaea archaeon]
MKLHDKVLGSFKIGLKCMRSIYNSLVYLSDHKNTADHSKSRSDLHQYWKEPWDDLNLPQFYLEGETRSQFLVEIVKRYARPEARILEIGCNVGRNLNYLFLAGFRELSGIEINEKAIQILRQSYPEMAGHANIYNKSVEEAIRDFEDNEFDIVFTMAVLEHIHRDSEWIFSEMVRITRNFLITIEDERSVSWKHFPRNYKEIFESQIVKQVEVINCSAVEGLDSNFFARVLKKVRNVDKNLMF